MARTAKRTDVVTPPPGTRGGPERTSATPRPTTRVRDRSHAHANRTRGGPDRIQCQLVTGQRYTGLTVIFSRPTEPPHEVGTDSGGPRYVQSVCAAAAREYTVCACAAGWRAAAMCEPRACVLRAMRGLRRVGESAWWYRGWFRGPLAAHPVYRDIRSSECVNPSGMVRARIFSVLAGSPRRTPSQRVCALLAGPIRSVSSPLC